MGRALQNVVLVGAGHAHALALLDFARKPLPGSRLTLITRRAWTPYSAMLPGVVAGFYAFEETNIDVRPLCSFAGANLVLDEAMGIDLVRKRVVLGGGPFIPFDILSLDIGSAPNKRSVPGALANATSVKPMDGFLVRFETTRRRILSKLGQASICVVGAGAAGVEMLLAIEGRLRRDMKDAGYDAEGLRFTLLSADTDILITYPSSVRRRLREILSDRGITVIAGAAATGVEGGIVHLEGGETLSFDEVFWATEPSPAPWLADTGLKLDAHGFVEVDATLQSTSHPGVFAAGDVASLRGFSLPKAGVHAVRQGPTLSGNLRRAVSGELLQPYKPQSQVLSLISTGERYAVGTRNGLMFEGAWVWQCKDWLDRRYMAKFKNLSAGALAQ
jgi:selenide,water dikinase